MGEISHFFVRIFRESGELSQGYLPGQIRSNDKTLYTSQGQYKRKGVMIIIRLGDRLKEVRQRLGLTQREFAERIPGKYDYSYIGKIERNQQYPSLKLLEKISKTYSIPLGYFFDDRTFGLWNFGQDLDKLIKVHIRLTLGVFNKLIQLQIAREQTQPETEHEQ